MTIRQITAFMDTIAPPAIAQEWDNVGLLVGDPDAPVTCAVVALDITEDTLAFAKAQGASLIVAHHPLIFSPVKRLLAPSVLYQLASSGIAAFAAHTNLDEAAGGVNDALAQTLGLTDVEEAFDGLGRVGRLPSSLSPSAFAALVKERLQTAVQVKEGKNEIRRVALVGGAGGDFVFDADADAFLTGEMKHHEWIAVPASMTAVVAGHYATENVVVEPLCARLSEAFPAVRFVPFLGAAPYHTV